MEKEKLLIGKTMMIGISLSVTALLFGGITYLAFNGHHVIHYQLFQQPIPMLTSIKGVLFNLTSNPLAWIQLGLLILIGIQMIRVILTAWLFIQKKDKCFAIISLLIFAILIHSLF